MILIASSAFAQEVKVEHLGPRNSMVRIDGDARYLLMPVEEACEDAKIDVLVDGKIDRTIFVRLAKDAVDYEVPFDLTPYKGHDVILNVVSNQDMSAWKSDIAHAVCWDKFALADSFDTTNREKYRPAFHHAPLWGWMNDPNGMVYKDGTWHLYFQHNPYGSKWQNMTWGHSSSTDLVNWKHHPEAIEPDGIGTIFSGSSVLDPRNTAGFGKDAIVSLYTSAGASQVQSMAHSSDNGETFTKYPGNPVITLPSEARDPNMFWYEPTKEWILVLAHPLEHEMLIFASPDLTHWQQRGSFGKGLGCQNGIWECPDLFELPVDGSDQKKWVFLVNLNPGNPFGGSGTQYFTGTFDGTTFTPDKDADGTVPTKWMDWGKDNYASVSFSDAPEGRRVLLGWMSNWEYADRVPTRQFRSANTLPRDMSLFTGDDGRLYMAGAPSPEVNALRGELWKKSGKTGLSAKPRRFELPTANDGICEIDLTLTAGEASEVVMTLANKLGNEVTFIYNAAEKTLSFDRRNSGLTSFANEFPAITTAPVLKDHGSLTLRIFIDRASIEVFGNDGELQITNLVFPESPYSTLSIKSEGKATLDDLRIYPMKLQ